MLLMYNTAIQLRRLTRLLSIRRSIMQPAIEDRFLKNTWNYFFFLLVMMMACSPVINLNQEIG